jgi:hypothetical protein
MPQSREDLQPLLDALGPRAQTAATFESVEPLRGSVSGAFRNQLGYVKVTLLLDSTGTERTFHAHDLVKEKL